MAACIAMGSVHAQDSALRRAVDPLSPSERAEREASETPEAEPDETGSGEAIAEVVETSDALRPAIAQMMMVTLTGSNTPNPADREYLTALGAGAVIVPPVSRQTAAANYVTEVRRLAAHQATHGPPIVGTDLFNLPRSRGAFRSYFAQMPSLMALTAADHPPATQRFAEVTAEQLTGMGFSLHIGPSLSLAPDIEGGIASVQCLGSDPVFAARTATTICSALLAESIIPMATGFPGGANNRLAGAPPVLLTASSQLAERDLVPFRAVIEAGVPIMHVGTTLVPTIDPSGLPACLSPIVIRDYLRRDLGFQGVVVAGPIDSPDLATGRSMLEAATAAIEAGADMLVWTGEPARVAATVERLARAVEAGEIPEERIRASVARIAALKEEFKLAERPLPSESGARRQESNRDYAEVAYEVERRSVTVLYDRAGVLPLKEGVSEPILVTGAHYIQEMDEALEKHFKRVLVQPLKSAQHGGAILDFDTQRLVRQAAGLRTLVAVFSAGTADAKLPKVRAGQRDLIIAAKASGPQVVVVLLGCPGNIDHLLEADAIVHAYPPLPDRGGPPLITQTIRAVADVLVGEAPLRLLPPLRDIEAVVGQTEVYNALDVIVSPTGRLPVAIPSSREPGAVLFPAGHGMAYMSEGLVRRARWQFGDGGRSRDLSTEYTHTEPGRYPVTLTVEDQARNEIEATFHVVVREPDAATAAAAE